MTPAKLTPLCLTLAATVVPWSDGHQTAWARSFETVTVTGNRFVPEEDILYACDLAPGRDYERADIAAREECLQSTEMFESVEIRPEGDALVVDVEEIELRPGRLEFSLAYDTQDKVVGTAYFERYNLFPDTFGSVELRLTEELGSLETSLFYSGLGEGKPGFGLDGQVLVSEYDDQGFKEERARIEGYVAMDWGRFGRGELGLGYRALRMTDGSEGQSRLLAMEAGRSEAPYLRFSYEYQIEQLAGAPVRFSFEFDQIFWDIGNDTPVSETRVAANAGFALGEKTDLLLGLNGGIVRALNDGATRAVDRFQLGGAAFRGFAPRGIGPVDGGYFIGGNAFAVASIELRRDIGELFDTPAQIGVFAEAGSLWSLDNTLSGAIDDSYHIRTSVGVSMTFDISDIPVSLYVAQPIAHQESDETQAFGLTISTRF